MPHRSLLLIAMAALALAACGRGSSPSPISPDPQVLGLTILAPEVDAAVVGSPLALRARATMPGGGTTDATETVEWASSDPNVATVDAHGVLSALAHGRVTLMATAKNVKASLAIDVVPNVAGDWSFTTVGTTCDDERDDGCFQGKPISYGRNTVALVQTGHRVTGTWTGSYYVTGAPPFEGRVNIDGSLDLHAEYCDLGDYSASTRYSLRDWHMDRSADGSYAGRLTWEQAGSPAYWSGCVGEPTERITEVLAVSDFRR